MFRIKCRQAPSFADEKSVPFFSHISGLGQKKAVVFKSIPNYTGIG